MTGQRIAFRADASLAIGTGHLMRCLALADGLRAAGAETRFLARHLPAHLRALLEQRGHAWRMLDEEAEPGAGALAHAAWLGTTQAHDARQSGAALADGPWDWLVVDHYALDAAWELAMQWSARRLLVIDDIADRPHACSLLLDQNLYAAPAARYANLATPGCRQLLGPSYALLRPEFAALRPARPGHDGAVRRLLVFFGGVDQFNLTGLTLQALAGHLAPTVQVDVVIGLQHPARVALEEACVQAGYRLHVQTNRMAELMAQADLAIGGGGSASWERCCLGVPAILVSLADNQLAIAEALQAAGAALHLGPAADLDVAMMARAVTGLMTDAATVRAMSAAAHGLADGQGVARVCACMAEAA